MASLNICFREVTTYAHHYIRADKNYKQGEHFFNKIRCVNILEKNLFVRKSQENQPEQIKVQRRRKYEKDSSLLSNRCPIWHIIPC